MELSTPHQLAALNRRFYHEHAENFDDSRPRLRAGVLQQTSEQLAAGGRIALSNWQLTRSPRMLRHVVPWSAAGLSDENVEPGDYLLSWERNNRRGLRYVHVIDEQEAERMAAEARLPDMETFTPDAVTSGLF